MSRENVAAVEALVAALPPDFTSAVGDEGVQALGREALAEFAEPDFECVMAGPDPAFRRTARGVEGFAESWSDWLGAFESFHIDVEKTIDAGDQVLTLATLRGRTRTGGVEMEQPAAAVFTCRNRKITRMEFHLDRELAFRTAGLEPGAEL
jgi:ketosteroid isomerase-like protein